ncbi:MAG: YkgJ family cysteine cluster protein [Desulfatibacillaceae bacterium]
MKTVSTEQINGSRGRRIGADETFCFACHPGVSCFTLCCRNLNLFLYPYDVLRLRRALDMDSGDFIDRHTDVVMREGNAFPDVLLRMADNEERTCPFLTDEGCTVYQDRPESCRSFPVENGLLFDEQGQAEPVHFFRPPDFCEGRHEPDAWTPRTWAEDQGAVHYQRMNIAWGKLKAWFTGNPWGPEGPQGRLAKMAFMATYNPDAFRGFVLESSLGKRFDVKPATIKKIKRDDEELLLFGMDWVRLIVFGQPSKRISPRR